MFTKHIRLGYQGPNRTLRPSGVLTDRTARLVTVLERGVAYLEELYERNLDDLLTILRWNVEQGILFYRASSSLAPHVTNPKLLRSLSSPPGKESKEGYRRLVYELDTRALRRVGRFVRQNGIRLTFHPEPFIVLSADAEKTESDETLENSFREIYYHYKLCKYMHLGPESVVVLHGGGVYGNKLESMARWVRNFLSLPIPVRNRLVLENDEKSFSIADVLEMSDAVREECGRAVPVVFDVFHYECHDIYLQRRGLPEQPPLEDFLPHIVATWPPGIPIKMHLSQQRPSAPLGAHSDFISGLPSFMRSFHRRFAETGGLDVMVEAKLGERAVLQLLGRPLPALEESAKKERKMGGEEEVAGGEESCALVLASKARRRALAALIPVADGKQKAVSGSGPEAPPRVVIAEGAECKRALEMLRNPESAPRALILVEPTEHVGCPDNVIVHGKLPLGAERCYKHVVAEADSEAVATSAARFL